MNKKRLAILCNGSVSHKDQGIALYMGKYLEANYSFTPSVDIIINDVTGTSLISTFMEYEEVIVLDVIGIDDTPGSVYHFPMKEFRNLDTSEDADETGVLGCLNVLQSKSETLPNTTLLAIVPDAIEEGVGLSPILKHSVDSYALHIVKTVEKQGFGYDEKHDKEPMDSIVEKFTDR